LNLQDPETGKTFTINSSNPKLREKYNKAVIQQEADITQQFRKMKIDLVTLNTDKPYAPELMKFFKFRIRMKNQR